MNADRRSQIRTRLFHKGSVVFNGRQSVMACTIRNRSQTGALVRMSDGIDLPEIFDIETLDIETSDIETLDIKTADQTNSRRVRQCWRRGDDVGVLFLPEGHHEPSAVVSLAEVRAMRAGQRPAG